MNLLEINVFILWFQSEFWNDFVAMKLLFSRINEERKCTISLQQGSVCLAGKREGVHFVPNPFDWGQKWDLCSDLQWIPHWTHLFGAFGRLPPTHPSTKRWFGAVRDRGRVWEVCLRLVFWCCEWQGYSLGSFPAIGASMSSVIEAEKVFWKRVMRSFEKIFWRFLRVWFLPWDCDSFLLDIFLWRTSVFSCALKFPGCEGQVFNAEEALKAERVRERWLPNFLGQAGFICSIYDIDMIRLLGKFFRKFGAFLSSVEVTFLFCFLFSSLVLSCMCFAFATVLFMSQVVLFCGDAVYAGTARNGCE